MTDNSGKNDYIAFKVNNTSCNIYYDKFKNYFNSYITIIGLVNFTNKNIQIYLNNELIQEMTLNDSSFNDNQEESSNYFKLGSPNIINMNNKNIFIKEMFIFNKILDISSINFINSISPVIKYSYTDLPSGKLPSSENISSYSNI